MARDARVVEIQTSDRTILLEPRGLGVVRLAGDGWGRSVEREELPPELREKLERATRHLRELPAISAPDGMTPEIFQLNFATTNLCNIGCTYCYNELPIKDRKGSETRQGMSTDTAREAVDALLAQSRRHDVLQLAFIGGEVLLERKRLYEVVDYAHEAGAKAGKSFAFSIYTNGLLVSDEVVDWADENGVALIFSLDAPPLENDRRRVTFRGKGTARLVLERIARYMARTRSTTRTVTSVISDRLAHTSLARYLYDLGFNHIQLQPAYGLGGYAEAAAAEDLEALAKWYRSILLTGRAVRLAPFIDTLISLTARGGATKAWYPCNAGHSALGVGEDGRIFPCHHFFGEDGHVLGHVRDGLPTVDRRHALFRRVDQREPCASCWARHLCGGECYHRAMTAGQGYFGTIEAACDERRHRIGLAIDIFVDLVRQAPKTLARLMHDQLDPPAPRPEVYAVGSLTEYEALLAERSDA